MIFGSCGRFFHENDFSHFSKAYTKGMVRKVDNTFRHVDLEAATQMLLDLNPAIWGRLMQMRGDTKRNVLLIVRGDHADPVLMKNQSVAPETLTLEPGQVVVRVSGLDEQPSIMIVKISGDVHWQMVESAIMDEPARVIPIDENRVLVMDNREGIETGSQIRPEVEKWDGIDAA